MHSFSVLSLTVYSFQGCTWCEGRVQELQGEGARAAGGEGHGDARLGLAARYGGEHGLLWPKSRHHSLSLLDQRGRRIDKPNQFLLNLTLQLLKAINTTGISDFGQQNCDSPTDLARRILVSAGKLSSRTDFPVEELAPMALDRALVLQRVAKQRSFSACEESRFSRERTPLTDEILRSCGEKLLIHQAAGSRVTRCPRFSNRRTKRSSSVAGTGTESCRARLSS